MRYDPLGYCMYCGATEDLSKEHIVPLGLNGDLILPESSCERCRKITGQLEERILRGPMWKVRVRRGLRSRRKHKQAPTEYPLTVVKGGKEQTIFLKPEDYPVILDMPKFRAPGCLRPEDEHSSELGWNGIFHYSFGKTPGQVARELGVDEIKLTQHYTPYDFARFIAKIAWGYAVAMRAAEGLDGRPPVVGDIIGKTGTVGRWVGTYQDPLVRHEGELHRLQLRVDKERGYMDVGVQLFADSGTPHYGVILAPGQGPPSGKVRSTAEG